MYILENFRSPGSVSFFETLNELAMLFAVSYFPFRDIVLPGEIIEAVLYRQNELFEHLIVGDFKIGVMELKVTLE